MNPQISMSQSARYVTQSSIYDCPILGRLTDRKIKKYQKLGFYTQELKQEREERIKRDPKNKRAKAKQTMMKLLEEFL